jgi:aspartyl-tRNA synthetase
MTSLTSIYRTHTCGELRRSDVGKTVTLSGWILRKRDHGGVVFIDLRDTYGVTQIVLNGELGIAAQKERIESVVTVTGKVLERGAGLTNDKLITGAIEILAEKFVVQSRAEVLPFLIAEDDNTPETNRLTYRFLDLRREKLHKNIKLRSDVVKTVREIMTGMGFTEFQTPILTSSSPEGARDFIVPSRLHAGKFYALPQAPQQFKQLLMVSGFDRYFQIAPCFRDEDARADRSPGEFYQIDIECSFVEQDDVFAVGEKLLGDLFTRFAGWNKEKPWAVTSTPFPRIPYDESVARYGSDKPDLRCPLLIDNLTELFSKTEFKIFKSVLATNGTIRGIWVDLDKAPSRKYFDDTIEIFTKWSGQGVAYLIFEQGEIKGSVAKFITAAECEALKERYKPTKGTGVLFLGAGDASLQPHLGKLRVKLGSDFNLSERDTFRFCWVTDFPFYERDVDTGAIQFVHNPFTMPQGGLEALNTKDPLSIKAYQYDIVCNGYELSSGGIRNHLPEVMYRAFEIVGYSREHVIEKFGGMVKAFTYGAPPHGGFAPGVDRIVMLLAGEEAIRDVIAFPLAQNGEDLLMNAPGTVSERQLRDVHIAVVLPKKE